MSGLSYRTPLRLTGLLDARACLLDDTRELTDCQLLQALASGETSALGILYDRYAGVMLAVANRILGSQRESEDLVHDVLVEAWRKSATYSQARGSVRTWLFVRLRSRALDRIRRSARHPIDPLKDPGADPRPEASPVRNTEYSRVREAIATLPEAQRKVLELAYFGGLSSREVALALGIPVGTVKSRTAAGLHKLRAAMHTLADEGGAPNG